MSAKSRALLSALASFFLWGLLPIYWKQLKSVPATQIICHRIIWSVPFLLLILAATNRLPQLRSLLQSPKNLGFLAATALLLGLNWMTYIWAVISGYVLESSLGYFISPLLNALFGMIFLKEKLNGRQYLAIGLSAAGVFYLTLRYGQFPWIALALGSTFAFYGLARKVITVDSLAGVAMETILLFPVAGIYLLTEAAKGTGVFFYFGLKTDLFLVGAGMATSIPLFLFVFAARNLPLTLLGILQNIVPTGIFLLGVIVYHEAFTTTHLVAFSCIWAAIAIYCADGILCQGFSPRKLQRT